MLPLLGPSETEGEAVSQEPTQGEELQVPAFLKKLFDLVSNPMNEAFVSWSKSGRAILIKDPPGLASDVLPMYFKHNNLRSFVRQLNAYGFRRNEEDIASGVLEYSHELFRAGHRDLLKQISRRGQGKRSCDEEEEWRRWHENAIATVSGELQRLQTHVFNEITRLHAKLDYVAQLLTAASPQVGPWQPSPQPGRAEGHCHVLWPALMNRQCCCTRNIGGPSNGSRTLPTGDAATRRSNKASSIRNLAVKRSKVVSNMSDNPCVLADDGQSFSTAFFSSTPYATSSRTSHARRESRHKFLAACALWLLIP